MNQQNKQNKIQLEIFKKSAADELTVYVLRKNSGIESGDSHDVLAKDSRTLVRGRCLLKSDDTLKTYLACRSKEVTISIAGVEQSLNTDFEFITIEFAEKGELNVHNSYLLKERKRN